METKHDAADAPAERETQPIVFAGEDRLVELEQGDTRPLSPEERDAFLDCLDLPNSSLPMEPAGPGRWRVSGTIASTARLGPRRLPREARTGAATRPPAAR
jgi:hypothetical protein